MKKRILAPIALLFIIPFLTSYHRGLAASAVLPSHQQQATPYPINTADPGAAQTAYPLGTVEPNPQPTPYPGQDTPAVSPTATRTLSAGEPTLSPSATPTPHPSPTAGRDLFATENAEIKNARVTPPASETPRPTPTGTSFPSPAASITPPPSPAFQLNQTWFLAGLLVPVFILVLLGLFYRLKNSGEFKP